MTASSARRAPGAGREAKASAPGKGSSASKSKEKGSGRAKAKFEATAAVEGPAPEEDSNENASEGALSPMDIPAITLETVRRAWSGFMGEVRNSRRALAAFLASAVPHKVEGNRVVLAFPVEEKFSMNQVKGKENRYFLSQLLGKKVGQPVMLACQEFAGNVADPTGERPGVSSGPAGGQAAHVREEQAEKAEYRSPEITKREPAVRRLLEAFDGEILAVRENPNKK